jgi:ribosome-associated protein
MPVRRPVDVPIREESIRLGQFLKLADLVEVGSDAKELISAGEVLVNGEPETRRGRQLRVGDVVELDGRPTRVARRPGSAAVLGRSSRTVVTQGNKDPPWLDDATRERYLTIIQVITMIIPLADAKARLSAVA